MKSLLLPLLFAVAPAGGPLWAQSVERPAVVELYTSEGCSSCPPADALLEQLAARPEVIALALHVDYWDYIGWKDTFGDPAFAERQRNYARAAGEKMIYTPQMVVNGKDMIVGSDAAALAEVLEPAGGADAPDLQLSRDGASLTVRAPAVPGLDGPVVVELVRYLPRATVAIDRGENAGQVITYANTVTSWREIGRWDGQSPLELEVRSDGDQPAVVLIQEQGPGRILAAALAR